MIAQQKDIHDHVLLKEVALQLGLSGHRTASIIRSLKIEPVTDGSRSATNRSFYFRRHDAERCVTTYRAWKASNSGATLAMWIDPPKLTDVTPTERCPPSERGREKLTIRVSPSDPRVRFAESANHRKNHIANTMDAALVKKKADE